MLNEISTYALNFSKFLKSGISLSKVTSSTTQNTKGSNEGTAPLQPEQNWPFIQTNTDHSLRFYWSFTCPNGHITLFPSFSRMVKQDSLKLKPMKIEVQANIHWPKYGLSNQRTNGTIILSSTKAYLSH